VSREPFTIARAASLGLAVGLLGACFSSSSPSSTSLADANTDSTVGAGVACTPGSCGGGQACCLTGAVAQSGGGVSLTGVCTAEGACTTNFSVGCTAPADCADAGAGAVCCASLTVPAGFDVSTYLPPAFDLSQFNPATFDASGFGLSVSCQSSCSGATQIPLCTSGQDCPTGTTCYGLAAAAGASVEGAMGCVPTTWLGDGGPASSDAGDGATVDATAPSDASADSPSQPGSEAASEAGPPLTGVTAIAVGDNHTCALLSGGTVACWGSGSYGQLGSGAFTGTTMSATPVMVESLSGVTAISAGGNHTCAIVSGGAVECWGYGGDGELGNGYTANSGTPVQVSGLTGVIALGSGEYFGCALLSGGTASCWGDNSYGQIGDGTTTTEAWTPVTISTVTGATAIGVGSYAACTVMSDGSVDCWGANFSGHSTPAPVSGVTGAQSLGLGYEDYCAVLSGGTALCWGANNWAQLGEGNTAAVSTPTAVSGLTSATAIAMGFYHACALLSGGGVDCWGRGDNGQLGNGSTTGPDTCGSYGCATTPVAVSGISTATAIATSSEAYHSCALLSGGTVECWGRGSAGQLGNGTYVAMSSTPVLVEQ
jgi:alpha-tubulin suppressor-like RCC1 family protein